MNEFKIYRDGQYDKAANVRLKARNKLGVLADHIREAAEKIDYYFVNH